MHTHIYTGIYIQVRTWTWSHWDSWKTKSPIAVAKKEPHRNASETRSRPGTDWCTYDWLVMQHKLNCIGCLHTPISPVSHGHRAALSGARSAAGGTCVGACVHACVGGKRRVWHAYRAFVCGKNWHWAREGYRYPSFATRIDTPTGITAKNTTPSPSLSIPITRSFPAFARISLPLRMRDYRANRSASDVSEKKSRASYTPRTDRG